MNITARLDIILNQVSSVNDFFVKLSDKPALFIDFLYALWANDTLLQQSAILKELFHSEVSAVEKTFLEFNDIILNALSAYPWEWQQERIRIYENTLKKILLEEIENWNKGEYGIDPLVKPLNTQLIKSFLAKFKIGISFTFYEEFTHSVKINDRDKEDVFLMELRILGIIRSRAIDNTDELKKWEDLIRKEVDACEQSKNPVYCKNIPYTLAALTCLWHQSKPAKLLDTCWSICTYLNDPSPLDPAVRRHLSIYFRYAVINMLDQGWWDKFIKIKNSADGIWLDDLINTTLRHEDLKNYEEELRNKEEEYSKRKNTPQNLKRVSSQIDEKANS